MKRALLLGLSALMLVAGNPLESFAQPQLGFPALFYLKPNLFVSSPASIAGRKDYNNSFIQGWGGNPDTATIINVPLRKLSPDSLGCTPPTNSLGGFYAVVFRGACEFGAKALAAQNQGAKGVLIVNNAPGLLNMGAGAVGASVTIPVFMITQTDGLAINALLNASQTVTITYSPRWGTGLTNDLSVAPGSMARPHAQYMPLSQLTAANGNPPAYRNYVGGFVANIGTATQSNVRLRATTTFIPASGTPTVIRRDSVTVATFASSDSIKDAEFVAPVSFHLNPTTNGRYNFRYDVVANTADQSPGDNVDSVSMTVTDSLFSKGRYDLNLGVPERAGGIRSGNTSLANFTWGPLFYVARGNYLASKVQFSISADGVTDLTGTPDIFVTLFKWTDGAKGAPADSIIQGAELRPIGTASKTFVSGDLSGGAFTADFTDFIDDSKPAQMRDSGWYWVAVQIDNTTQFLGIDTRSNYYTRSFAAQNNGATRFREFWAPQFLGATTTIDTTSTIDTLTMFPFVGREFTNIDQIPYVLEGDLDMAPFTETYTPAVALHISRQPVVGTVSVGTLPSSFNKLELFPNPASKVVNVSYDLAVTANRATFHIVNAMGQSVRMREVSNTKSGTVSFSTLDLASGQYYMIIGAGGKSIGRPFTVGND